MVSHRLDNRNLDNGLGARLFLHEFKSPFNSDDVDSLGSCCPDVCLFHRQHSYSSSIDNERLVARSSPGSVDSGTWSKHRFIVGSRKIVREETTLILSRLYHLRLYNRWLDCGLFLAKRVVYNNILM